MHFEIVGKITEIEIIAVGPGIRILGILRKRYGRGRWRKLKGVATVRLSDGRIRLAASALVRSARNRQEKNANQTVSGLRKWPGKIKKTKFVVCISSDDPDLLTPRRIYQVLPDESAAKSKYIRVVDNEGEDYLYPADYFLFIELPRKVELALLKAA
jgi:hypothetical protein